MSGDKRMPVWKELWIIFKQLGLGVRDSASTQRTSKYDTLVQSWVTYSCRGIKAAPVLAQGCIV